MASYPFNPAESYAFVRLDSDKFDNLRPNGDYDVHFTVDVRTIGLSHKYLPSVKFKKSRHPFRDRCPP